MFPKYRHTPIFDPERKRCPVCHHSVYSLAGIHPQCAKRLDGRTKAKNKAQGVNVAVTVYQAPLVEQTDHEGTVSGESRLNVFQQPLLGTFDHQEIGR
jgi:hypothetical protein